MKIKSFTKAVCVISCIVSFIYTISYMSMGVVYKNSGALSKIGLTHHLEFVIWGMLTLFALCFNIAAAYRRYTKTKIHIPLLIISFFGMVLTLCFDFDFDNKLDYYLHCAGSLTFSAVMGITIFILFLFNFNKSKMFKAFTIITGSILIIDLICLLIFKETALIETLPVFAGYILLNIVNLRNEKVEITQ